jgi:hypothetical protein
MGFIREENIVSPDASMTVGYLADKGLIPLPDADRKSTAAAAQNFNPLSM